MFTLADIRNIDILYRNQQTEMVDIMLGKSKESIIKVIFDDDKKQFLDISTRHNLLKKVSDKYLRLILEYIVANGACSEVEEVCSYIKSLNHNASAKGYYSIMLDFHNDLIMDYIYKNTSASPSTSLTIDNLFKTYQEIRELKDVSIHQYIHDTENIRSGDIIKFCIFFLNFNNIKEIYLDFDSYRARAMIGYVRQGLSNFNLKIKIIEKRLIVSNPANNIINLLNIYSSCSSGKLI